MSILLIYPTEENQQSGLTRIIILSPLLLFILVIEFFDPENRWPRSHKRPHTRQNHPQQSKFNHVTRFNVINPGSALFAQVLAESKASLSLAYTQAAGHR
jgi:hypothetical protein